MAVKDLYPEIVKVALEKEGWIVAETPYCMERIFFSEFLKADGCEDKNNWLRAEKGGEKITVEVNSFLGHSIMLDYHSALGQMLMYQICMKTHEPDRKLWLAIPEHIYFSMEREDFYQQTFTKHHISFLVFDIDNESIVLWQEN
ncbi:MAG: element excision factor XisH family protein [Bacteroidia bacterium]